jgi:hypothetical protein
MDGDKRGEALAERRRSTSWGPILLNQAGAGLLQREQPFEITAIEVCSEQGKALLGRLRRHGSALLQIRLL